jgi:prepilin-type N-terminal cleavage/methylation domain-containing protein
MKKISKSNKTGFTLLEMVLVLFIILVLAAVLMLDISVFMGAARDASDKVSSQVATMGSHDRIERMKNDYNFGG